MLANTDQHDASDGIIVYLGYILHSPQHEQYMCFMVLIHDYFNDWNVRTEK